MSDPSADPPIRADTAMGRPPLPNPRKVGTFGMLLFLASLTMLFVASMVGYAIIRLQLFNPAAEPNPPLGRIDLPVTLWLSTFIILVSSAVLHYAGHCVSLERQKPFRKAMLITTALGYLFLIVQGPALYDLVQTQAAIAEANVRLYMLIVLLVVLHGLHVIGGLIPLTAITLNAHKGKYDHEHYHPVALMAIYWHFLDVVWLAMFCLFHLLG